MKLNCCVCGKEVELPELPYQVTPEEFVCDECLAESSQKAEDERLDDLVSQKEQEDAAHFDPPDEEESPDEPV